MEILRILLIMVGVVLLLISIKNLVNFLEKKSFETRKKKEKWGQMIVPTPDIYWDLGRVLITKSERLDSRPFLEDLGFKFLGYANEKMLWVEPPIGWTKKHNGNFHTEIFDETGKNRFTYFYKNDIMNMSDYRAELHSALGFEC